MHVHAAPSSNTAQRVLRISLVLTLSYIAVTAVAGIKAHSLALLSEAGHNVSDFVAIALSLVAVYFHSRPATDTKTYGYQRAGVLAAFVNGLTLIAIAILIFIEAFRRLYVPVVVKPGVMMAVAAAGVVMNGLMAALLWKSGNDVNIRSAFVHMLGDTLSTAGVIFGGLVILYTGRNWIDPALSFAIGALVLWSSWGIVHETLNILLEGTPRGLRLQNIISELEAVSGVNDVHDLHVWSIGSHQHALSCHISIADIPLSESETILRQVKQRLRDGFHIEHTTIQFEHVICETAHGCVMPVTDARDHGHSH
jgi:cobalt-zinc-cadmium efflux system protein